MIMLEGKLSGRTWAPKIYISLPFPVRDLIRKRVSNMVGITSQTYVMAEMCADIIGRRAERAR